MDNYPVEAGTALPLDIILRTPQGDPITGYTGAEALAAEVWPGGDRSDLFHPSVTWSNPAAGALALTVTGAQTAGLDPGRYFGQVILLDPAAGPLVAYRWSMDLSAAPGLATAPPAYCRGRHLLLHARGWLKKLPSEDDEAGYAEQCGRARTWLDDLILARSRTAGYLSLGSPGYGSWGGTSSQPNVWLRGLLDGPGLVVRDWVIEATAKRALSYLCDGQLGSGDKGSEVQALGRRWRTESSAIAASNDAEIATGTGPGAVPNLFVHLGSSSVRGW